MRDLMDRNAAVQQFVVLMLVLIVALGVVDVILDGQEVEDTGHFLIEIAIIVVSLATVAYITWYWLGAERSVDRLDEALEARAQERDAWRRRASHLLNGLGAAVDEQFAEWELTPAERETALMVLKGLSHREIARVCDKSDRTVRQHAASVYRKSRLSGRAELSAFFLEDLLLPASERGDAIPLADSPVPEPGGERL